MSENGGNSTAKMLKIVIALLSVVIVGMVIFLVMNMSKQEQQAQVITEVTNEKDALTQNLQSLQATYDDLRTNNDTINAQLDKERQKVEMLLDKVKRTEASNRGQLKKYENELGTLRSIMQNYIRQIDSLNTMNQALVSENRQVKEVAQASQQKVEELTQKTDVLSSKVEKGALLKARDITGLGLNSNSKDTERSGRVQKIRACFTLIENELAEKGPRKVYLRVKGPDGIVLAESSNNLFPYQGSQLVYSAVREADYQGQDVEMCIFYDTKGTLTKGTYELTLYTGGALIGTGEVKFK